MIRVLIVDDQTVLRESLKYLIEKDKEISVIALAKNGKEAFDLCSMYKPDVILMDIMMPDCDGIEGTRLIKSKYPNIKVIILTTFEDEENISCAIGEGADGYMLKDVEPETLRLSIKSAIQGLPVMHKNVFNKVIKRYSIKEGSIVKKIKNDIKLSDKELNIIQLVVNGKSNKEIAALVNLSDGRVRNIVSEIFIKFEVMDRTQLAVLAVKQGIV